jgi:hypothetical protein
MVDSMSASGITDRVQFSGIRISALNGLAGTADMMQTADIASS